MPAKVRTADVDTFMLPLRMHGSGLPHKRPPFPALLSYCTGGFSCRLARTFSASLRQGSVNCGFEISRFCRDASAALRRYGRDAEEGVGQENGTEGGSMEDAKISRRSFLTGAAVLGGATALGALAGCAPQGGGEAKAAWHRWTSASVLDPSARRRPYGRRLRSRIPQARRLCVPVRRGALVACLRSRAAPLRACGRGRLPLGLRGYRLVFTSPFSQRLPQESMRSLSR